jgi:hypothetical protein
MQPNNLGQLQQVNVREVWQNEARHFTPWLIEDDNIQKLGDALGLELEVENTEVSVGPYSADILAKDVGNGKYVVIENQLEKTDHDHLGKSITYASALDASAIVWIAVQFTEEHQKALDWLNEHTDSEIGFYGVIVELWSIDESKPAVRFNVISRPTDVARKVAKSKATENLTDAKKIQLEFWTEFRNRLLATKKVTSCQMARPQYWHNVSLGRSWIHLSNTANVPDKIIGVRVYIRGKVSDVVLEKLMTHREAIEQEIGEPLNWNPNPDNKDKIIAIYRDADLFEQEKWPEYQAWMIDMNLKFIDAFKPRVSGMKVG